VADGGEAASTVSASSRGLERWAGGLLDEGNPDDEEGGPALDSEIGGA
jgi:hypothetical protein